jgi:enhancer of polycomb-like protein
MADSKPQEEDTSDGVEYRFTFSVPPPSGKDAYFGESNIFGKDLINPSCRLRYGRGGRVHLEARRPRPRAALSRGVVSDSDSDDEMEEYYPVSEAKTFDYRCALNSRARPDGVRPSGDQTAAMAGGQAAAQQAGS